LMFPKKRIFCKR